MIFITSEITKLVIIFIDLLAMETSESVVIVGGGLAGLTAAIHLSKIGYSITLIEKNSYPKHKVCGEYVSNEVLPYLDWLGVNPSGLKPANIENIHFSIQNGASIKSKLPLGGFGISRYHLDYALYQKAIENGCAIIQEVVNSIDFIRDIFTVQLANNDILTADFVLGAFGKRSNLDQKIERSFIQKKSPWLAAKGHYKADFPANVVGLHHFKGGYCGVSKIENDIVNICYLADFNSFRQYKSIEEYQKHVVSQNPFLNAILSSSTPLFEKPLTISQISFEKKRAIENHIIMIGDSAGLIHPLCGNGMAMAIHSAKIACELINDYYKKTITTRQELEEKYEMEWNRSFRKRMNTGRWLAKLLHQPQLSEIALRIIMLFPALFRLIVKSTHGEIIKIEGS